MAVQIDCQHTSRARYARGVCRSCYDTWRESVRPELKERRKALTKKCGAAWYLRYSEKLNQQRREKYQGQDIATHRERSLKQRYGMTIEDYDAMLKAQGGVCAICHRLPRGKSKGARLYVDHIAGTKTVRGLLCAGCNSSIGQFNHDPDTLKRAISYLEHACSK